MELFQFTQVYIPMCFTS